MATGRKPPLRADEARAAKNTDADKSLQRKIAALPINGLLVVKDEAAVQRGREILTRDGRNWREIQFIVPNDRTLEKLAGNYLPTAIADDVDAPDIRKLIESRRPK